MAFLPKNFQTMALITLQPNKLTRETHMRPAMLIMVSMALIGCQEPPEMEGYAAVIVAQAKDSSPLPPSDEGCLENDCNGTGIITHGDDHRTKCPCVKCQCGTGLEPTGQVYQDPRLMPDYAQAYKQALANKKPLAVYLGDIPQTRDESIPDNAYITSFPPGNSRGSYFTEELTILYPQGGVMKKGPAGYRNQSGPKARSN